jgi:hypothetical protein
MCTALHFSKEKPGSTLKTERKNQMELLLIKVKIS